MRLLEHDFHRGTYHETAVVVPDFNLRQRKIGQPLVVRHNNEELSGLVTVPVPAQHVLFLRRLQPQRDVNVRLVYFNRASVRLETVPVNSSCCVNTMNFITLHYALSTQYKIPKKQINRIRQ